METVMNTCTWRQAGAQRLVDAYNTPDHKLAELFQIGFDAARMGTMPGLAEGLVETALKIVRDAQATRAVHYAGTARRLLSTDFEIDINMAMAAGDVRRVEALVALLLGALEGTRQSGVRVAIAAAAPAIKATADDKPLRVIIESMPDRVTTTSIERNEEGDIVHSSQTETDG